MQAAEFLQLRAFLAVAEQRSFSRAAAHLGISASALSQTIRRLEERLQTRLLNRTTRSVALSEAGEALLAGVRPALRDLEEAWLGAGAHRGAPAGRLRINTNRIAAFHHLAPRLGAFIEAFPAIALDIVVEDNLVDVVTAGFDAGIRLGEKLEQDMIAVPIGGELRMVAVASPDYCARHGVPEHPRDLLRHRCLRTRWPTDGSPYRWEFERGDESFQIAVAGPVITNQAELLVPAACDGAGIAYLFEHEVGDAIAAGRLRPLLTDWSPPFPGFYLYYPGRRHIAPPLRAFIDFMTGRRGRGEVASAGVTPD